ncbi:nonribosomal peptide synthetase subunit [Paenibacillus alvei DSM 29]|uniref:non-ribosomal peptide synthetase n=1 Tax=Paenibacillus alvei TaxID=44250 RepID=UPI00028913C3|nr:non-ribosomal peptide synthetase [Paenibacillus alvei]EJW15203.1 nonribosomal peptide synthetase subunit [Paenibacillus alvei DSM 29]
MTDLRDRLASLTPEQQRVLADRLAKDKTPRKPPIKPQSRNLAGSVMSFAQQRLWLLYQLEPGMNHYHIPLAFEFIGELDIPALQRAWIEVIRRHESLRTRFAAMENAPVQIIEPIDAVQPMRECDLYADDRAVDKYREARRMIDEEAFRPFDLEHGPPCRGLLIKAGKWENFLLFAFHHIVFDGWSLGVFQRELLTLYSCYSQGKTSPLPEIPFQYADYAIWQRNWLTEEELDKQLQYWLKTLHHAPSALELPTDRPRSAMQTFRGDAAKLCISEAVVQPLLQLSRREGSTLFMTLLAAFQALLYRYSGQHDFCIGTPIANRGMSEIEGMIGFFVNTLVIRSDLSSNPTFRELMQQTKKQVLGAYEHQDLPFDQLVQALQSDRETSHSPLFQVMFAMNDDSFQHMVQSDGLQIKLFPIVDKTSKYDLSMTISHIRDQGLTAELEYNTDLFDSQTIERMLEHFQHLLESIVLNPDLSVSSLEIMGECERQLLLSTWNRTEAAYASDMCIHEIVEKQASLFPNAIAVTSGAEQFTYRDVNIRANRMARHLQRMGIGPEVLVGLLADRSAEQMIGLLAILKSGGAYVPIDPAYPDERIAYMIEDAQIHVLLTQERHAERVRVRHTNMIVLLLDGFGIIPQDDDELAPDSGAAPGNLAYVVYTSGSTGRPKGVEIEHRSLLNLVSWHQSAYRISSSDRATMLAGPAFDASVWELWPYLASGASIHIPDEETRLDPDRLRDWLVNERITVSFLPTPLAEAVVSLNWPDACSLRCMLTGGDRLRYFPPETLPFLLFNHYGPSEGTVVATSCQVPAKSRSSAELTAPTIGRPIANMRIYLLDRQHHPVPIGVVGELYIAGHGLARGYLRRPELTAEQFGYAPSLPGERMYRTGDLARFLPDGSIEFMGRADDQIKIRGYRIEPGEIEAALTLHPAVEQAIVAVKEHQPEEKRLIAYVIPSANTTHGLDLNELRLHVQTRLPKYMVPAAFVVMEALPMTPNGKVDRNALPSPNFTDKEEYVPPRTRTEKKLADIWSQVLGIEPISIHDNYFSLGGDSILSTQIAGKVRQVGLEMRPKYLFQYQSIAELAPVLEALKSPDPRDCGQREVAGSLPLTPIQRWLFEEMSVPEHFNQSLILSVNSQISYKVLQRALAHVVAHHDALRLRFTMGRSGWEQAYAAFTDVSPLKRIDLRNQPASLQADAFSAAISEAQTGFDLSEGMLLRAIYFDCGAGQAGKLALIIHHLAIDGVSWRILLDDLCTSCQQLIAGESVSLPAKTASYQDWARSLAALADTDQLRAELEYWLHQVNSPPLIPLDCPDGANTTASMAVAVSNLSSDETRILLQEAPSAFGAQIDAILLAALGRAVSGWSGERKLFIHMEGHGREELVTDIDISRTVGWFTNMYPFMLEVKESADINADIQAVKERLHRIPHRGIGYGLLRYMTENDGISNQLRKLPRPMMSFNYLGQFNVEWSKREEALFTLVADTAGQDIAPDSERVHYIDVAAMVTSGCLHISLSYSENVHHKQTIENLARRFEGELRTLIGLCQQSKCHTSVNELKMNDASAFDTSSKWFVRKKENPQAAIRLFCLPYAGGNASIFRSWHEYVPAFAEVCAVQYPGRGARLREPAHTSMPSLLEAVSHAMRPLLDKPYILFGYSMGALLAYELSILLSRSLNRPPLKLIVAGLNAPFVQSPVSPIHDLPEEEFRKRLRLNGGMPEELIDDEELLDLLSPSLRADFSVCETYEYTRGTVPCPIVALGGQDDEFLSKQSLASWRILTNADFSCKLLPGGHFFLHAHPEQLLSTIRKEIECVNTETIYASKT